MRQKDVTTSKSTTMRQSERAYLALRDEIVSSALAPGEALPESATAARLNVSRCARPQGGWPARSS
jgi:DNA-binding GntR family transcriptional regulator